MTMLGAIALDGFRGFLSVDVPTNGDVFLLFVKHQLIPNLKQGDIVVMDNLSSHKRPVVTRAIRKAGADVLFIPPYSPEYNPIEQLWSKLKQILRRLQTQCRESFEDALAIAMESVTTQDIIGWTRHAGYSINSI
jgi:transposase